MLWRIRDGTVRTIEKLYLFTLTIYYYVSSTCTGTGAPSFSTGRARAS
jgi:hypothetical protein